MDQTTLQDALAEEEIKAANELTRRWLTSRAEVPAVASGLGIWPLLAVLATGAVEATREELLEAAGIDIGQAAYVPAALIDAARSAPALRFALAAWAGPRIALDPEWVAGMPVDAIGSLTGDPAVDKPALDDWASRNTDGLIERMPINHDEQIELLIASALSVRTTWRTPFDERYSPFASGPWKDRGKVLTAAYKEEVLRVGPDAAVLTVQGDDDIDVLLALGREETPAQEVMSTLIDAAADPRWGRPAHDLTAGAPSVGVTFREYPGLYPQTTPETTATVPAFALVSDLDLLDDAAALGLELASDDELAQFDRLAAQRLYVSQAKQTATAVFSATGFEAAAVTAFGLISGSAPSQRVHRHRSAVVTFDRPFAYLAHHRPSGLILIAGWVNDPDW